MPDHADAGYGYSGGGASAGGSMSVPQARLHAGDPAGVDPAILPGPPLERAACLALLAFAAALQVSIAAADILLTIATLLWLGLVIRNRERIEVPDMFWPLAAYAGATLVASFFSVDPRVRIVDYKQLVLLVIVP